MYKTILAETLAEDSMKRRGWSAEQALEVARVVLLENPRRIFARDGGHAGPHHRHS